MAIRFFNWEGRPALILPTPQGGEEGVFVQTSASSWLPAHTVEILESGYELTRPAFLETFPNLPALERAGIRATTAPTIKERPTGLAKLLKRLRADNPASLLAWVVYLGGNLATFTKN
jgi:hypothetical protein